MSKKDRLILAIDQGTTSSRVIAYNLQGEEVHSASRPLPIYYPEDGWVEQKPEEVWSSVSESLEEVVSAINLESVLGLAVTNQRETVVAWNPETGETLSPAIVWQCRRSKDICARWKEQGREAEIKRKTGLVVDAYFSGSKILWMLENISGLKEKEKKGDIVFGTMDTWVVYKLSQRLEREAVVTEPSNASRTMLFDINQGDWDQELLEAVGVSSSSMAKVLKSDGDFPSANIKGKEIPVLAILGDQQASLKGLSCDQAGQAKCTFGTGAFLLVNEGEKVSAPGEGLLSTVAWQAGEGKSIYATEGSVFMAGALVQWLRDSLGIVESAEDTESLAAEVEDSAGVVVVPAFTGLGAPHWDPDARGMIAGLTRESNSKHIVRASLEAVAFQVRDLLSDFPSPVKSIKVDGGMSKNKLFCQMLADICQIPVEVSPKVEATAFGAARLAAESLGHDVSLGGFSLFSGEKSQTVVPSEVDQRLEKSIELWERAVERSKGWSG